MAMKSEIVIELIGVEKKYRLFTNNEDEVCAIKNVNLKIIKGEKIGLTGDNGSGKTTLLKLIAGITTPTKGEVHVKGKIVSLINLEAGFNSDLTGRENIIINGMIYGMTKREVELAEKKIIDFADIGNFIDVPFFTYSSGMKFRLALSVALATSPDIVLMDEVFISGDIDFQIKTFKKIEEITKKNNVTLIMSSHYPLFLQKCCNKYIIMNKGKLINADTEMISDASKRWNNYLLGDNESNCG